MVQYTLDKGEFAMSIKISKNYIGDRYVWIGDTIYQITISGYIKWQGDAMLSSAIKRYAFVPCSVISIIVSDFGRYIECATFRSDDTLIDTKELTFDEFQSLQERLDKAYPWYFIDQQWAYTRFVYIVEERVSKH